ncbi:gag-pol polyprotein [Tanacetum coccineum]
MTIPPVLVSARLWVQVAKLHHDCQRHNHKCGITDSYFLSHSRQSNNAFSSLEVQGLAFHEIGVGTDTCRLYMPSDSSTRTLASVILSMGRVSLDCLIDHSLNGFWSHGVVCSLSCDTHDSTKSQEYNLGSKDRPTMLGPSNISQWVITFSTAVENQRTMTVAGARETVGSQIVQQNGIQCFNCKGFGHYAKECRKPKRVKDYTYHKEKMMMCKQAEHGVPPFMAKIQEVLTEESSSTDQPLEQVQNNDENNVFANERQHYENNTAECADERAALANLIANLTLDTEENKMILKQLKKANASLTQEIGSAKTKPLMRIVWSSRGGY